MLNKKNIIFLLTFILLSFFYDRTSYAIGEFSIGANIGVTKDLNNLERDTNQYNTAMVIYNDLDPNVKKEQIPNSYCLVWGLSLQYQFNFLLFRLGATYTRTPEGYQGYIKPVGGEKNKIKVTAYQCTFPMTIALIVPLKEKTYFYMGAGLSYHIAYSKITQSKPGQTSGLFPDSNRRNRYTADFPGFHFIFGAEAPTPFSDRFTFSIEWIHQEGRSSPLKNGGWDENEDNTNDPLSTINVRGDFIIFGINYYVDI